MKCLTSRARLLITVSCLTISSQAAYAQDTAAPAPVQQASDDAALMDIVVTAQRRSESLNDVPISISALSSDTLQGRGIADASDLARVVPGFSASESGLNTPIYTLRGVGFNESSLAATSTVSVAVDEVGLPFPATTRGATLDLSRIEVVKGPQGTLYGQNTTGGAINYISNRPTNELSAGFLLDGGRFNRVSAEAYLSGPITSTLKARLAVRNEYADGWQQSQSRPGDRNGQVKKTSARLTIDWEPVDRLNVSLVASGWIDKGQTQAPQLRAVVPVFPQAINPNLAAAPIAPRGDNRAADWDANPDLFKDDEFGSVSGRIDYDLTDTMTLTSISAYSKYKDRSYNEYDGTPVPVFGFFTFGKISNFQQEVRLTGALGQIGNFVAGGNYAKSTVNAQQTYITGQTSANRISGVQSAQNFTNQKFRNIAAFASVDWNLAQDLTLTTGGRYTDYKVSLNGCSGDTGDNTLSPVIQFVSNTLRAAEGLGPLPSATFNPGLFDAGQCTTFINPNGNAALTATPGLIVDTLQENNISWRAALNYKPSQDLLFYVSASRGYKSGSFPNVAATSFLQYAPATQEKLTAYEAGAKATLLNGTWQLNGAVFYYDYRDKQQRGTFVDPVFGPLSLLINIPKSNVIGAEMGTTIAPARGLRINGAVTYLKTRIDEYQGLDVNGVPTNYEGAILSFAPKWSFDADIEYRHPIGQIEGFVGASYAYRSTASAVNGEDPLLALPSYNLVGARAGFGDTEAGWQLSVYGENLTSAYYLNNVIGQFDTIKAYVGMPTTYGVRLKYYF